MNRGAFSALILVLGVALGLLLARYYPVGGEPQELESILKRQNELLEQQAWLKAGGNVVLSVALCLLGTWLGFLLGQSLRKTA